MSCIARLRACIQRRKLLGATTTVRHVLLDLQHFEPTFIGTCSAHGHRSVVIVVVIVVLKGIGLIGHACCSAHQYVCYVRMHTQARDAAGLHPLPLAAHRGAEAAQPLRRPAQHAAGRAHPQPLRHAQHGQRGQPAAGKARKAELAAGCGLRSCLLCGAGSGEPRPSGGCLQACHQEDLLLREAARTACMPFSPLYEWPWLGWAAGFGQPVQAAFESTDLKVMTEALTEMWVKVQWAGPEYLALTARDEPKATGATNPLLLYAVLHRHGFAGEGVGGGGRRVHVLLAPLLE